MSETEPRIAIVHEYLTRMGGAEKVVKTLADLFPSARIFTLIYDGARVGAEFPPWRVETSVLQKLPGFLRRRPKLLLPWIATAVEAWDFSDYDLVISSSSAFVHGILTDLKTRHICYCHSPARFLWDYTHEYSRENGLRGFRKIMVAGLLKNLRVWDRLSAHRVDRFLANSETVQRRVQKYFRRSAEVVYPPVEVDQIKMSEHSENYFLIVSQLTSYKRIDLAISVFNKLRRRLVIVGDGPQRKFLAQIAGPTIELLGFQSDASVRELLRYCRGLIFPGEDDFGIVPVEALAAGKPVLAFARGGARETVIPGVTGELFAEPTSESLEDGLARLLKNERNFRAPLLRQHAKKFTRANFEKRIQQIVAEEWEALQAAG